jgi:hypothetical protein
VYEIEIPRQASLTLEQSDEWLQQAAAKMDDFLDKSTSPEDRAKYAADLSVALVTAQRNALADPNLATRLNATLQPKTYEQLKAALGKASDGDEGRGGARLYEQIIEAAKQQVKELGCFVAGTLVHTKEGLRPIEQIKVGDYVLSKPESGQGELSYQRVTRTFEYEDREVYFVAWSVFNPEAKDQNSWWGERGYVVVTGAHPFWVRNMITRDPTTSEKIVHEVNAWMSVQEIYQRRRENYYEARRGSLGIEWELADGRLATLSYLGPLLQHRELDRGIVFGKEGEFWREDPSGAAVRFTDQGPVATRDKQGAYIEGTMYDEDAVDYDENDRDSLVTRTQGYLPMRRKVYNIEVEDTHTYYVGEQGVWVHNISGYEPPALTRNPAVAVGVFMKDKGPALPAGRRGAHRPNERSDQRRCRRDRLRCRHVVRG